MKKEKEQTVLDFVIDKLTYLLGGQKMIIPTHSSQILVDKYFNM
jgi:hypothetical protein